jgi:hypothetical protein
VGFGFNKQYYGCGIASRWSNNFGHDARHVYLASTLTLVTWNVIYSGCGTVYRWSNSLGHDVFRHVNLISTLLG